MEREELLNDNNNRPKESPLKSLEIDLKLFSESLREVAVEIMVEGLSSYPIFVAHQHEVKLGELILDKEELNTEWTIHASTLEEFIERGVIKKELKQRFIDSYKNAHDFMCVFVIVPEGANFVFFPYSKE
jgi:L-cysteine desulfidase